MPAPLDHPYASFISKVKKPSRYLGGEHGESTKAWESVDAHICLCFPDVYEVGMSHLGYKILYSILNAHPSIAAERAYAPWIDMEAELRSHGEQLRSLESARALRDFEVVGFSLQFELTFTNILQMLDLGGIPLRSAARSETDPLVIAGGPTATHPEPLAAFVDAFLIGDGEKRTPEIVLLWRDLSRAGLPRAERLAQLAKLEGVYVPSMYTTAADVETGLEYVNASTRADLPLPVQRTFLQNISEYPFPKDGPIANTETVFDRISIEIARGCTEGCRFCQAGMIYRPVRERDPAEIIDVLKHAVREGGYESASLTSLSTADYSAISPLIHNAMKELRDARAQLSVSSLRAYGLDEDVLDELKGGGGKGLTFAPEAGTQRMRDVVNKNVTEEQLLETARRVFSRGWSKMKLYFMIGLPTETDEDVRGIVQTGARALAVGRGLIGRNARVTVSVSTHVPKPHTPFQWCAMDERDEVLRKQQILRDEARRAGVDLRMHDSQGTFVEGIIARGDRTLCDVIETAYLNGARFDSWDDQLKLDTWKAALAQHGIDAKRFLGTLPTTARLPWHHIDVGLEAGFLAKEYRKALKNRLSPPCGKAVGMFVHHTNLAQHEADKRKLVCYDCGVACDLSQMKTERAGFLRKLGAERPRELITLRLSDAEPASSDPAGEQATDQATSADVPLEAPRPNVPRHGYGSRAKPPVRASQGTPVRVRLAYRKLGRAAFSSHLDLVRLLPRLFRRLGLPVYFSQGFHPKPVLMFGPALSLGVASLAEYVDIKVVPDGHLDTEGMPARLNEASQGGIEFFAARELAPEDPKLSQLMHESRYVAALPESTLAELGLVDAEAVAARVAQRRQGELRARRTVDGLGKNVDVGRYLIDARVGDDNGVLQAAGIAGTLVPITIDLRITPDGTAKISEALDALLDASEVAARFIRADLAFRVGDQRGTPLDLSLARKLIALEDHKRAAQAAAAAPPDLLELPELS